MADNDRKQKEVQLAEFALTQAQKFLHQKNDGKAFANFLLVFKLAPENRETFQTEFLECMGRWSRTLKDTNRVEDMLTCQHEACLVLPDCPELLNSLGTELFSLGFLDEAASYFRKALRADPCYLLARHNLQNLCGHVVERWHFRMLNDCRRNKLYRDTIHRAVAAVGESCLGVLDIGSGTGLLSMYAVEAGATRIYGCEMSKMMFDISRDCVTANEMIDKIQLINKKSTDLTIPEDIPARVSLVVTETFDAGLLGEHILPTLSHAWQHLLINSQGKKARVIPSHASVYVTAIECETIRKQSRSIYPGVRHLSFGDCQFVSADEQTDTGSAEPYTCHRLRDLPGGYKILSEKLQACDFTFDDPDLISKYMEGYTSEISLQLKMNGQLDALVVWFDLDLDDCEMLTSDPQADSCWEQAVYPILPSHLQDPCSDNSAINCSVLAGRGDILKVRLQCCSDSLRLRCSELVRQQTTQSGSDPEQTISNKSNTAETSAALSGEVHTVEQLTLSKDEVCMLNDLTWNQMYCQALEGAKLRYVSPTSSSKFSVLSLMKGVTTLPLQALKVGATEVCVVSDGPLPGLEQLMDHNDLDRGRVRVEERLEDVDGDWSVMIMDVVEPSGNLKQQVLEDIALARMTCLGPNGLVIPGKVCVYGLLIESSALLQDSIVTSDENTLGVCVSGLLNDFQIPHHIDVCLSTLDHRKLSEPFQLFDFDLNQPLQVDGDIEATFLHHDRSFAVTVTECGTVCGVVYWFDLDLSPSVVYSTLTASSHIRQGAFVQREPFKVDANSEIAARCLCKNSCLDVLLSVL